MTVHRLDNDRFGFDSSCFVCEPRNHRGLQVQFSHDDEAGLVFAEFELGREFSGAPNYVHGGIVLALLDEAMAWATIAVGERFAVTQTTTTTFTRPVKVGRSYRVQGFVDARDDVGLDTRAHVLDGRDHRCAEATARFVTLSAAGARSAIGAVGDDDARFLRGAPDRG